MLTASCIDDDLQDLSCDAQSFSQVPGTWGSPKFISSASSCYQDECVAMNFELNSDLSYSLAYTITNSQTDSVLRTKVDQGTFEFECLQAGKLSGRYSSVSYVEGLLTLNSDSLERVEWALSANGIEGLIIQPEYLGFTHDAYVMLARQ
ncbi:hypothetical protein FUA23_10425 [Neolewinella aurantiaca]|uniref:Uncharacterized protein n=1 Tax=Neolewinella aurantiaca TaxID=2602767 RepID=A0A5C7FSX0_9BACT|nr:hypothetical protein [Neolewinella aurantiaca]TXF89375.1 hypothetical protein FUA23_10425 [Neolewinella aurantiaca]